MSLVGGFNVGRRGAMLIIIIVRFFFIVRFKEADDYNIQRRLRIAWLPPFRALPSGPIPPPPPPPELQVAQ